MTEPAVGANVPGRGVDVVGNDALTGGAALALERVLRLPSLDRLREIGHLRADGFVVDLLVGSEDAPREVRQVRAPLTDELGALSLEGFDLIASDAHVELLPLAGEPESESAARRPVSTDLLSGARVKRLGVGLCWPGRAGCVRRPSLRGGARLAQCFVRGGCYHSP
jgi:hypothetical protein